MALRYRKPRHFHSQPPLPKGFRREPRSACVLSEINDCVLQDAYHHRVSPGFVISTILAKHYHVAGQPDFRTWVPAKKRKERGS